MEATGNNSSDFDGLANVLGEAPPSAPEVVAPQRVSGLPKDRWNTIPEAFDIGSLRPSAGGVRPEEDSRTAYAAIARRTPENVDSSSAPYARGRSRGGATARTQNNFSKKLDADGILNFKLNNRASSPLVGKDRARTPRRQVLGDGSAMTRSDGRKIN